MRVHVVTDYLTVMSELQDLREAAFRRRGRDEAHLTRWRQDKYDQIAAHVIAYDQDEAMVGALRLVTGNTWPLDEYCASAYDKVAGVELGRLVASTSFSNERRVMFELVAAAAQYSRGLGKRYMYGAVIVPLQGALRRAGVPFCVLSPTLSTYGETSNLVRFEIAETLQYYNAHATRAHGESMPA